MFKRALTFILSAMLLFGSVPAEAVGSLNPAAQLASGGNRGPGDGSTIQIEGLHATLTSGAEQQPNGDWVWTPENTNPDHPFTYTVTYSVSGEFDYFETGQIEIRIPLSVLRDQNGNPADSFEMSLPLEDDPNLTADNVFVYRIEGDEIVVVNRLPCPAAQHGYFDISFSTTKRTYNYHDYDPNGATPEERYASEPFQATLTIHRDGEVHTAESEAVPVYIDTHAYVTQTDKYAPQKQYTSWQSGWGTKPEDDHGQYYYLIWEIRSIIYATQRYDFSLLDTFEVVDGEIVAIKMQGQSTYVPISDPDAGKLYNQTASYTGGRYDYVLTRHLKETYDPQPSYTFLNKVTSTVVPRDGVDPETHADAQRRWTYEHPVFVPGTAGMSFDKYGLDFQGRRVYDSEDIRTFDLDPYHSGTSDVIPNLAWYTSIVATTYPLTVPAGADNNDPANYGQVPATVELTDNKLHLKYLGGEYGDQLVAGEYRFDKIKISYSMLDAYFDEATQSFKTKAVTYEENEAIKIYAQFGSSEWVEVGSFAVADATFTPTSAGTSHNVTADGKTIIFGDDTCTGYRLVATNKHYRTTLGVTPYVTLLRSDPVTAAVNEAYDELQNEIAVKNTASGAIYAAPDNTGTPYRTGSKAGTDYAIGILRHSEITKTVRFVNEPVDRRCRLTWTVSMNESYLTDNGARVYVEQESGVFYDLLPIGGRLDTSSVAVFANNRRLSASQYSVELQNNFRETGRTLMIVRIFEPTAKAYTMTYATFHSWDSIAEFGHDTLNTVAYETGNVDIGDGYPDNGGPASGSGKITDRLVMGDLDPDTEDNRFIYTQATHYINALTAGNLGLYKKVAAEGDTDYSYSTLTRSGGEYTYKIHFATDAATWARNMILFDSLENFVTVKGKESDWRGTLQGFDFTVLDANNIAPVLYYSEVENLQIPDLELTDDYDFSDGNWIQATGPNDPDLVNAKAFAIDLRKDKNNEDFVLNPTRAITVTVFMKAPDTLDSEAADPVALNNIYLYNSVKFGHDSEFADSSLNHQDYTSISFRQIGDINLLKIDLDKYNTTGEIVPIPGITFRLWGDSIYGDPIDITLPTNSEGKIAFTDIPRGEYSLQELSGTDDFVVDHTEMTVTIDHGAGLKSVYANLSETVAVDAGDPVEPGTVLGTVGNTAVSETAEASHLHFAMRKDGVSVDPTEYLP